MTYYGGHGDDTGTLSLPVIDPSWQNDRSTQDRYRLGRELARDFQELTFSSLPPPGGDHTDMSMSMDVGKDANATSTKRIHVPTRAAPTGPPGTMLYQTPTIDSRLLRDRFIDFTMAADDLRDTTDVDTYEIGRGNPEAAGAGGVSFDDRNADLFTTGLTNSKGNESKKRTGGKLDDKASSSKEVSAAKRREKAKAAAVDRSLGSPVQRGSSFPPTLDFGVAAPTPRRRRSRLSSGSAEAPSKIVDYVSNSGSGGSRASRFAGPPVANPRDSEEDALEDIGNKSNRKWFSNTRFQRPTSAASSRRDDDITEGMPAMLGRTRKGAPTSAIPKSFKSTPDFLRELGLDGHTQTINLQATLKELKQVGPPEPSARPRTKQTTQQSTRSARNADPSFMIPNMPDMTDLFGGNEVTHFSAKKGASAESHIPIDSIPIPHDSRALLDGMKQLQEKVAMLEDQIRRGKAQGGRAFESGSLEEERLVAVSSVAMAIAQHEDLKAAYHELRAQFEQVEQEKRSIERRSTRQREEFRAREERFRLYAKQARVAMEEAARREVEERQAAEREAARREFEEEQAEKREAERIAKQLEEEEREEIRRVEAKREFDRSVEEQLRKIRPDLFVGRVEPLIIPSAPLAQKKTTEEVDGRKKTITIPRSRKSLARETSGAEIAPEAEVKDKGKGREVLVRSTEPEGSQAGPGAASDDTILSISQEEVRRIAKEINQERKKRKAAAAAEKARKEIEQQARRPREQQVQPDKPSKAPTTEASSSAGAHAIDTGSSGESTTKKQKGRKVVKVVYLMDPDTTEIRGLTRETQGSEVIDATEPASGSGGGIQAPTRAGTPGLFRVPSAGGHACASEAEATTSETAEVTESKPTAPTVEEEAVAPVPELRSAPRVVFKDVSDDETSSGDQDISVDHDAEDHDTRQCTVCVRYDGLRLRQEEMERDNPLKDIDNSCLYSAPPLEPASKRPVPEGFEEEHTLRPSVAPQTQLERVVRQLRDEFRHLKL